MDIRQKYGIPQASGIGDVLQYSRHPEFYHRETGEKMVIAGYVDRFGIFDSNPYVWLDTQQIPTFNLWEYVGPFEKGSPVYRHLSELFDVAGVDKDIKPSMYRSLPCNKSDTITICSEASKRVQKGWTREIPPPVAEMLVSVLSENFNVVQVGGPTDYLIPGIERNNDMRGASITETHDIIAYGWGFIGVNSGMMHLAACTDVEMLVWLNTPVADPPWESDMTKYTAHDWLYKSATYIGPGGKDGVKPVGEWLKELQC